MRVLMVSTWETACGIAEFGKYLVESVKAADPSITLLPSAEMLDPGYWGRYESARHDEGHGDTAPIDLIHLNYHAALHSRWTPEWVRRYREAGIPVLVTYHDSGVPNSDQCKAIHAAANCTIVHEPVEDLPGVVYLRQGVPAAQPRYGYESFLQPILGTVGFPFPWKQYELLAEATERAGWALMLLTPQATPEQVIAWRTINPDTVVATEFLPAASVIARLSCCDATAFLYAGCGTGTSGAVRQGIAARKPVLVNSCRQFRDLDLDPLGHRVLHHVDGGAKELAEFLTGLSITGRPDPGIVALAHQDNWGRIGATYARLYHEVVAAGPGATVTGQAPQGVSEHLILRE